MPVDNIAAYVNDDDVGGEPAEMPEDKKSDKAALGKALKAALDSGNGVAICEAVKAIQDEPY